jgi:hypothetical protein
MTEYEPGMIVASDVGTVRVTNTFYGLDGDQYAICGQILDGKDAGLWATIDVTISGPEVLSTVQ